MKAGPLFTHVPQHAAPVEAQAAHFGTDGSSFLGSSLSFGLHTPRLRLLPFFNPLSFMSRTHSQFPVHFRFLVTDEHSSVVTLNIYIFFN